MGHAGNDDDDRTPHTRRPDHDVEHSLPGTSGTSTIPLTPMPLATTALPFGAPVSASFGALLQRWRKRAGWTQEYLAQLAHLSVRTIRNLERDGGQRPRGETARLLAHALPLSPDERAYFLSSAQQTTRAEEPPRATIALVRLPAEAPLLRPAAPRPSQSTHVRRDHLVAAIVQRLSDPQVRLVTMTGLVLAVESANEALLGLPGLIDYARIILLT